MLGVGLVAVPLRTDRAPRFATITNTHSQLCQNRWRDPLVCFVQSTILEVFFYCVGVDDGYDRLSWFICHKITAGRTSSSFLRSMRRFELMSVHFSTMSSLSFFRCAPGGRHGTVADAAGNLYLKPDNIGKGQRHTKYDHRNSTQKQNSHADPLLKRTPRATAKTLSHFSVAEATGEFYLQLPSVCCAHISRHKRE